MLPGRGLFSIRFCYCLLIPAAFLCLFIPVSAVDDVKFTQVPGNQTVPVNTQRVILKCSVGGIVGGAVLINWFKHHIPLGHSKSPSCPGFPRYRMLMDLSTNRYDLEIRNVTLADDDVYKCNFRLKRLSGRTEFRTVGYLEVQVPPTSVQILGHADGVKLDAPAGHQQRLVCETSGAKPPATIRWYRNDRLLPAGKVSYRNASDSLQHTLSEMKWTVVKDDTDAKFRCEAQHSLLQPKMFPTAFVVMDVKYPPSKIMISGHNSRAQLVAGQMLKLKCQVEKGNPSSVMSWEKNGQRITSGGVTGARYEELMYDFKVDPSDNQAVYKCIVTHRAIQDRPLVATVKLDVVFGPKTVTVKGTTEARMGETATLECTSGPSQPAARIRWIVEGGQSRTGNYAIQPSGPGSYGDVAKSTLTLPVPNQPANVVVECVARNEKYSGPDSVATYRHVISVLHPPTEVNIYGNEELEPLKDRMTKLLTCTAKGGNPPATIQWYRGSTKVTDGVRKIDGSSTNQYVRSELHITLTPEDNRRVYTCRAFNKASPKYIEDTTTLQVLFPPATVRLSITTEPIESGGRGGGREKHLEVGGMATLTCQSSASNPPANITMRRNGVFQKTSHHSTVPGKNGGFIVTHKLYVALTTEEDGALYICKASNAALQNQGVSTSRTLDVRYAPVFTNADGNAMSKNAMETVAKEGEAIAINLTAKANPSGIRFTWLKDGVSVRSQRDSNIITQWSFLNITPVTKRHAGTYVCNARNSVGTSNYTVRISVEYAAKVITLERSVRFKENDTATITCKVDGYPLPDSAITWERKAYDFKRSEVSTESANGASVLRIVRVSPSDIGMFTCVADNHVGKPHRQDVELLVLHKPRIRRYPAAKLKAAPMQNGSAEVTCTATGMPDVTFHWRRHGVYQKNNSRITIIHKEIHSYEYKSVLRISQSDKNDMGDYECIARNTRGRDIATIKMVAAGKPEKPRYLKVLNYSSDAVTLAWEPGFDGGVPQHFQIKYHQFGSNLDEPVHVVRENTSVAVIRSLRSNTKYFFSIAAVNTMGASEWTRSDQNNQKVSASTMPHSEGASSNIKGEPTTGENSHVWEIIFGLLGAGALMMICKVGCLVYCMKKRKRKKLMETAATRRLVSPHLKPAHRVGNPHLLLEPSSFRPHSNMTNPSDDGRLPSDDEDEGSVRTIIEVDSSGQPVYIGRVIPKNHNPLLDDVNGSGSLPRKNRDFDSISGHSYAESLRANSLQRRIATGSYSHSQDGVPTKVTFAQQPPTIHEEVPPSLGPLRSFSQELTSYAPSYVHYHPVARNDLIRRCSPDGHGHAQMSPRGPPPTYQPNNILSSPGGCPTTTAAGLLPDPGHMSSFGAPCLRPPEGDLV
nr:nephrin [Pontonema vulgare]